MRTALLALTLAFTSAAFAETEPTFYRFVRDNRPSDGSLTELMLSSSGEMGYTASVYTSRYDRVKRQKIDEMRVIGELLECQIKKDSKGLVSIACSRDDRPVDGALVEVKVTRTSHGLYRASTRQVYYDLQNHKSVETKEDF